MTTLINPERKSKWKLGKTKITKITEIAMEFKTKKKKEEENAYERGRTLMEYKAKRKKKNEPKTNERNEGKKVSEANEMKPQRTDERGVRKK